jgi:hypothetical protein
MVKVGRRSFGPIGIPVLLLVVIPYWAVTFWLLYKGVKILLPYLEPMGWWRYLIILVTIFLWCAGLQEAIMRFVRRFINRQQVKAQSRRDKEAQELLDLRKQLEIGKPLDRELPVFFFWFRPFDVADQLPFQISRSWLSWRWLTESNFTLPDSLNTTLDLETCVAAALQSDGVVVSLGTAGEAPGPGRIEVIDEKWQPTVELLGPLASAFYVLPSSTDGTTWEVNWLKENGRLEDSIFIMPPTWETGLSIMGIELAEYWHDTCYHLDDVVDLPKYDPKGMLIWLFNDGAVRRTRRLKRRLSEFRRALPDHILRSANTDNRFVKIRVGPR